MKTNEEKIIAFAKDVTKGQAEKYVYSGIHYKDEYAYFTDGRIAGRSKLVYVKELEEKTFSLKNYSLIEGKFPDAAKVFDTDGFRVISSFETEKQVKIPELVYKAPKINDFDENSVYLNNNMQFTFKCDNDSIVRLNTNYLRMLKHFDNLIPTIYYQSDDRPLIFHFNEIIEIVLMPVRM